MGYGSGGSAEITEFTFTGVGNKFRKQNGEHIAQLNPNGSPGGVTGFTTPDGRITIMMPHPERVILRRQHSWHPPDWGEEGPWLRMFRNARAWVD